ncbi:DUF5671 domain-containing protein [Glaciibacter sp. 2TAF33]|uniref:DUF5671 domain-containing protein n=1 Tax=Glaciibacter sp. 2TAF33 TaxID=3233015 RepID=UPI003F9309AD
MISAALIAVVVGGVVVGGIVVGGIVATIIGVRRGSLVKTGRRENVAQPIVRRLIVYVLLFALVTIAAIGLAGLLGRVFDAGDQLVAADTAGVARSLTFTLIGGPLAALLWWVVWRRAGEPAERTSVGWSLYLAAMTTVSLITFVSALLVTVTSLIGEDWEQHSLANALVWAGVWLWHRWMLTHPGTSPGLLLTAPNMAGSVFGLVIGVGGLVTALGTLLDRATESAIDTAIGGFAEAASVGYPWWRPVLQAAAWAIAGALVWWWHWFRNGARLLRGGLADVTLVLFGILGAGILTLGGAGTALFALLRLAFDRTDPPGRLLDPLGAAIASAMLGALVWVYHRGIARQRPAAAAARLVTSGIALVATASGTGVIINSLLATATPSLAGSEPRTLLLAGISALLVGGPVWWLVWKPTAPATVAEVASSDRRVYLIAVFGLSAVVALVALLVVGSRVFEFLLDPAVAGSLVERVRAPLGLLIATGLAFAYHFSVWRGDRAAIAQSSAERPHTIGHVILVTDADPGPLSRAITDLTGASVTAWLRADTGLPAAPSAAHAGPDDDRVAGALAGVSGTRVLVITGPADRIDVIPLRD